MIRRHGRNAAPIIDAGRDQARIGARRKIGWRLDIGPCAQNDACAGNGPKQIIQIGLIRIGALGAGLRTEILDDDFLHMPIAGVAFRYGAQGFQPFRAGFTNANQNTGGEGNPRLTCLVQHLKPDGWVLVRAAMMHAAGRAKPFTGAFQHDALASGHIAQRQQLCPIHHAGIGMGQQPGFTQHQITHGHQVFDGAGMAHFRQGVARLAPAQFGLIAQCKQRFRATCLGAGTRNRQHFVWRQIRRTSRTGFFGEGAVMADITAELGQRNEDLARI